MCAIRFASVGPRVVTRASGLSFDLCVIARPLHKHARERALGIFSVGDSVTGSRTPSHVRRHTHTCALADEYERPSHFLAAFESVCAFASPSVCMRVRAREQSMLIL